MHGCWLAGQRRKQRDCKQLQHPGWLGLLRSSKWERHQTTCAFLDWAASPVGESLKPQWLSGSSCSVRSLHVSCLLNLSLCNDKQAWGTFPPGEVCLFFVPYRGVCVFKACSLDSCSSNTHPFFISGQRSALGCFWSGDAACGRLVWEAAVGQVMKKKNWCRANDLHDTLARKVYLCSSFTRAAWGGGLRWSTVTQLSSLPFLQASN